MTAWALQALLIAVPFIATSMAIDNLPIRRRIKMLAVAGL
jgi:hypothetical protein